MLGLVILRILLILKYFTKNLGYLCPKLKENLPLLMSIYKFCQKRGCVGTWAIWHPNLGRHILDIFLSPECGRLGSQRLGSSVSSTTTRTPTSAPRSRHLTGTRWTQTWLEPLPSTRPARFGAWRQIRYVDI